MTTPVSVRYVERGESIPVQVGVAGFRRVPAPETGFLVETEDSYIFVSNAVLVAARKRWRARTGQSQGKR